MANADAVGVEGVPFDLDVERGKVREFARATHSTNPDYLEREGAVSPPTFLTTTLHWQPPEGNPWKAVELDGKRGLHAEQQYEFFGPPAEGRHAPAVHLPDHRRVHQTGPAWRRDDVRGDGHRLRRFHRHTRGRATMTGVETARPATEA